MTRSLCLDLESHLFAVIKNGVLKALIFIVET